MFCLHRTDLRYSRELRQALTANGLEEDAAGSAEMERTAGGVDVAALAQIGQILDLVAVEVTGQVQLFAPNDDHFAALQQVLGNNGRQATDQMAATIDDNRLFVYWHK